MVAPLSLGPIYHEHRFWRPICYSGGLLVSLSCYAIVLYHSAYPTCGCAIQFFRLHVCIFHGAYLTNLILAEVDLLDPDIQCAIGVFN
jgi:hypothetical protein